MSESSRRSSTELEFEIIVKRLPLTERRGGPWLVRVYCEDEHVHSSEGGVALSTGMREAQDAILKYTQARIEEEEAQRVAS